MCYVIRHVLKDELYGLYVADEEEATPYVYEPRQAKRFRRLRAARAAHDPDRERVVRYDGDLTVQGVE